MPREIKLQLLKAGQPNETIFVLGSHGSGKTTLIANLVREKERFIIFDTKKDFDPVFFGSDVDSVANSSGLLDLLNRGRKKIIVRLFDAEDPESLFNRCCDATYRWHVANQKSNFVTWFALDEFNAFCSTSHCSPEFTNILQRGRSCGIRKIFGAQWFGTVPTWARDGFSELYCFRHNDESGLDRLEQFGMDSEEIRNLPQYSCLYSGNGKVETLVLVPDKAKTKTTT